MSALPMKAVVLLGLGGIAYTIGVFFFIAGLKTPVSHVVWHLFVLVGSVFHFFSVREAIFHKGTDITWLMEHVHTRDFPFIFPPCTCNCNFLGFSNSSVAIYP